MKNLLISFVNNKLSFSIAFTIGQYMWYTDKQKIPIKLSKLLFFCKKSLVGIKAFKYSGNN